MKKNVFSLLLIISVLALSNCSKNDSDDDQNNVDTTEVHNDSIPAGWSIVGNTGANERINKLAIDGSGNIYAVGYFTNSDGYRYVAKWNGTTWSELGNLKANNDIYALAVDANDNVFVTGAFSNFSGYEYVAKWDGTAWSDIGIGDHYDVLVPDEVGNIYGCRSKWNGISWSVIGGGYIFNGSIYTIASNPSGSEQYVAGEFSNGATSVGGYKYVAKWSDSAWSELGSIKANNSISCLVTDNSGNVYAAGSFTNGANSWSGYKYLAKWDGTSWNEIGSLNANHTIDHLAVDKNSGNVYASGNFTNASGQYYIAKWDGTTWTDLGSMGQNFPPIIVGPTGKLYSVLAVLGNSGVKFYVVVHD